MPFFSRRAMVRLGGADGAVQQDDALLGAVALGRGLEDVDQLHQRDVEAEDGVAPPDSSSLKKW